MTWAADGTDCLQIRMITTDDFKTSNAGERVFVQFVVVRGAGLNISHHRNQD